MDKNPVFKFFFGLFFIVPLMVKVQYFGHSFFKVSFPGKNILFDPFLKSEGCEQKFERQIKCAAKARDLKDIALILISHEHFDHFDKQLVEKIAARDSSAIISAEHLLQQLNVSKRLLHPIKTNETATVRGVAIKAIAAHHPQAFYPLGFLVSCNGKSILHAGDTDLIDDFSEISPDIALLPIGGAMTMDCIDAVRAVKTMKPRVAIPMHYNTFKVIEQDPAEFKARIDKSILKTKPVILKPGQTFMLH
jgi:L-ascorbate metabolism protein UlaG (beta-lactamase superfamily)